MKHLVWSICLVAACTAAAAQTAEEAEVPSAAERVRIETERRGIESTFSTEQAACYQKFAVNDCLVEAKARRRAALSELRRRELSLNDAERQRKGAEQVRRLEQKTAPGHPEPSARPNDKVRDEARSREQAAQTKADARGQTRAGNEAKRKAFEAKQQRGREKAGSPGSQAAAEAEQRNRYNDKLRCAAEHKARLEAKRLEQKKPSAAGLPAAP